MKTLNYKNLLFTLFILFIPSSLFSLDTFPINDTFSHSSANGYSRDDGDSNELKINKDRVSQKTYHFGAAYANKTVTVTFDARWHSGWESSGRWRDYLYVWFNGGTKVVNESFSGSGSKSYTLTTTTNATGNLRVKFKPNTTANSERIYIDNVEITYSSPPSSVDLSIDSITDSPDPVAVDEDLTYTVEISNSGATATNVELNISLLYSTLQTAPTGWNCNDVGTISCTKIANMSNGDSENVVFLFTAPSSAKTLTLYASLGSVQTDSNTANNTETESTDIQVPISIGNDICYINDNPSGFFGFMTDTVININNVSGQDLTDTEIFLDTSGFGSFMSSCSIDSGVAGENCSNKSSYQFGSLMGLFPKGTLYNLNDKLTSADPDHTVEQSAMFDMSTLNTVYAKYTKGGNLYNMQISACVDEEPVDFTCAYPRDFQEIFNQNIYGKMLLIGNTSLCKNVSGSCGNPGTSTNNSINMMYNDFDTDPVSTSNSSAALLDVPSGKKILFAGLFWQGYMVNWSDAQKATGRTIKYKFEGDSYQIETNASMNWVYFNSSRFYYQGYLEITDYVKAHGGGYYWVADIATMQGKPPGGSFGAWSLAVVYEDEDEDLKNITLFRGYQAFAGSTDRNNAVSYASSHGCDTSKTGVGNAVSSTLSGFLTPKEHDVTSTLAVFAGEGDIGISGDSGSITDSSGTEHKLSDSKNPQNNIMNATISKFGSTITTGKPYIAPNSLGIDIDIYDVSGILDNKQTSTDIKFTTSGDGYMPGMYGLETELYVPEFCYDYSYKQNGIYFTELNDGSKDPKLTGSVSLSHPIEMGIYIKNKVESDILVKNFYLNVLDINTSQSTYIRESTRLTAPSSIIPEDIADSFLDVNDSNITNVPVGNLDANDYFYFYYNLQPVQTTLDDNMKIKAYYNIQIAGETIAYELQLGKKISLCTDNNFRYQPASSIFNLVHKNYYDLDTGGPNHYYNIPTQVVNREGDFKVIALEPDHLDTLHDVSTVVAVDLVDLSAFHDSNASCQQLSSAVSDRVWVIFDESDSQSFNKTALQTAIDDGLTDISNSYEFYKNARQNATFRITYNSSTNSTNSIIDLNKTGATYSISNYDYWNDISNCMQDVDNNPLTTDTTATYCTNGTDSFGENLTSAQVKNCMECIYGFKTKFICSRDNFAIRPEAFNIKIKDQNQTTALGKIDLDNSTELELSAGYNYYLEVNASSHTGTNSSNGYTYTLDIDNNNIFGYVWEPRNGVDVSGCNDTNDTIYSVNFSNGIFESNTSMEQVGDYRFSLLDKTWTSVDSNPSYMLHHTGSYFKAPTVLDCVDGSSAVESNDPYTLNLNGCEISSTHTNVDTGTVYRDYNVTFHPYKFDMSNINPTFGLNFSSIISNSYIYMADMALSSDENMSFHLNGDIKAVGYNNSRLNNFVNQCFSTPISLSIDKTDTSGGVAYQYRLNLFNKNGTLSRFVSSDLNNTTDTITINSNDFQKDLNGSIKTILNLNFDRSVNTALNPRAVLFSSYDINSSSTFNADLINNKRLKGKLNINKTLLHYYGRTHAIKYSFENDSGMAFIYYEIFCNGTDQNNISCNKTLLPNGVVSRYSDDPRWFINTTHTSSLGNSGAIQEVRNRTNVSASTITESSVATSTITYTKASSKGYPYKTTVENNASNWLIYDRYNPTVTTNKFQLEFYKDDSGWAGVSEANISTIRTGSRRTNRRSMW